MASDSERVRRFMRLRTLVEGAVEVPAAEREGWLERTCEDEDLLREAFALLRLMGEGEEPGPDAGNDERPGGTGPGGAHTSPREPG